MGVTSTNPLVDIVQFFSDNIFADLQADPGSVHPILQVDAIRYLWTFRNQVGFSWFLGGSFGGRKVWIERYCRSGVVASVGALSSFDAWSSSAFCFFTIIILPPSTL